MCSFHGAMDFLLPSVLSVKCLLYIDFSLHICVCVEIKVLLHRLWPLIKQSILADKIWVPVTWFYLLILYFLHFGPDGSAPNTLKPRINLIMASYSLLRERLLLSAHLYFFQGFYLIFILTLLYYFTNDVYFCSWMLWLTEPSYLKGKFFHQKAFFCCAFLDQNKALSQKFLQVGISPDIQQNSS